MSVLLSAAPADISIGPALGYSFLGIAIVFCALVILWGIINVMSAIYKKTNGSKSAAPAASAAAPAAPAADAPKAIGTAGQLKIHDVPEKTAAILMAIVADKMNRPINELRFISIKEVK